MVTDPASTAKCVYVAPTKVMLMFTPALNFSYVNSGTLYGKTQGMDLQIWRSRDTKFVMQWFQDISSFHESGCELTGDTVVFGKGVWGDAKNAQIM